MSASAKKKKGPEKTAQKTFDASNVTDALLESERGVDLQLRASILGQAPIEELTKKYIPSGKYNFFVIILYLF